MPHCIVEYSVELEKSLNPDDLVNAVYQGALKSGLFEDNDIKSRAIAFDKYQTGAVKSDFVHVTAKLMTGRTVEQRSKLSLSILSELEKLSYSPVSITVEIVELEKASYAKVVI